MRLQQKFRWLLPALCWLVSGLVNNALAADRPNILFCIADDWSHNHAGVYGNTWVKTPSFDTIARRGVLFTRAYTPNAKCAPSRAIILTGRNSWQLEDACNHVCNFPPKFKSWIEALADHGYACGYTGKGWGPGIAKNAKGQHRLITGKAFTARKKNTGIRGISNNDYSSNFADFLKATPGNQPWCFWYGTTEPHRSYQYGVGVAKAGKQLSDIKHVPTFWPDNDTVRNDMLDYAFEVEHYDTHLGRILKHLEAAGQLDNTLVVATSDHGMPFPRCKGQAYDYSNHVPLAIMWPGKLKKVGRVVDDYVSFADFAPTFLEVAGLATLPAGLQPTTGQSLMDILGSEKSGQVNSQRDHVLIGKERHDIGRPNDWGYPIRGIVKNNVLYIRNYETDRWPAGNPETGYLNCDGSPTKTLLLNGRRDGTLVDYWKMNFGKRPTEELYDLDKDPDCVHNLAKDPEFTKLKQQLAAEMITRLKKQQDPRLTGNAGYFDTIPFMNAGNVRFHERYIKGEKVRAGWVNPGDFEKERVD